MIGAGCCELFSGGLGAKLKHQRRCDIGTGALHVEMVDFCSGDAVGRRYLSLQFAFAVRNRTLYGRVRSVLRSVLDMTRGTCLALMACPYH